MKTKLILTFILLFSFNKVMTQDFDNIKTRDTLYIFFDENIKLENLELKNVKYKFCENYNFIFKETKSLNFISRFINNEQKNESFYKPKSFIVDNFNKILNSINIKTIGLEKLIHGINEKKLIIFIIDKKDFKRRKIYLKRVYLDNLVNTLI